MLVALRLHITQFRAAAGYILGFAVLAVLHEPTSGNAARFATDEQRAPLSCREPVRIDDLQRAEVTYCAPRGYTRGEALWTTWELNPAGQGLGSATGHQTWPITRRTSKVAGGPGGVPQT